LYVIHGRLRAGSILLGLTASQNVPSLRWRYVFTGFACKRPFMAMKRSFRAGPSTLPSGGVWLYQLRQKKMMGSTMQKETVGRRKAR
jgi:hypothetical protein